MGMGRRGWSGGLGLPDLGLSGPCPHFLAGKEAAELRLEMNHPPPRGRRPLGDEVTTCQLEDSPFEVPGVRGQA